MRKTKLALVVTGGVLLVATTIAGGVFALNNVSALINGEYPTIVEKIATKFNLNPSEVEQVFESTRTQERTERLTQAVKDGDITEAQKNLILEKETEFRAGIEKIKAQELTEDARHEAMQDLRSDLIDWAEENDIPTKYIMMGGMNGMGKGMGMGMGDGTGGMGRQIRRESEN